MARGRKAAPATLRLLNGRSDGRDSGGRPVDAPPEFKRVAPNPPSWLSAEAKREWKRVVPGLTRLDLLKPEDRAMLTVYCETWSQWVSAIREVHETGTSITTETGTIKRNPAVAAANDAAAQLRSLAQEFGLTPAAESKLTKRPDESGDDNPYGD